MIRFIYHMHALTTSLSLNTDSRKFVPFPFDITFFWSHFLVLRKSLGQIKKKYVSRPRPLHFLTPPLFFIIFYEQRFLTLRSFSYNIEYV